MLLITPFTSAQEPGAVRSLDVAVRAAPPFAFQDASGEWSGIAIELWESIAEANDFEYEYRLLSLADLLDALEQGEIDVAVAALTTSAEREKHFDFTQPFMQSGLGIATEARSGGWLHTAKQFLSLSFLKAAGALGAILLAFGALIWLFERKKNEQFAGSAAEGVGSGFWWSAVTMTTVGYGDKAPVTLGGRIVGLVWMFAAIIIISGFTAAITSSLTVGSLQSEISEFEDLRRARVGAIEASSAAGLLERERVKFREYASLEDLIDALEQGRIDAAVHDAPILRYALNQRDISNIRVLSQDLGPQIYAFGLPADSDRREAINRALLEVTHGEDWRDRMERYLGDE